MPAAIDVYKEWLGIPDPQRPLNYYQLLRLKQFEDDTSKIRANYRKMNAHVRKYAAGEYAQQSQDLLNELAKAMLHLTDAGRKAEYDAAMGRKDQARGRRSLEEILIRAQVVDQAQLAKARTYADTVGVDMRDALVQQKLAKPDVVMQAYAESIGVPYVDLADVGVDEALVPQIPAYIARQHSCAPVMIDDGQVLMASPNPLLPEAEEELRLRLGMPVRTLLCTPAEINVVIGKYYPKDAAAAQMANPPAKSKGTPAAAAGKAAAGKSPAAAATPAKGGPKAADRPAPAPAARAAPSSPDSNKDRLMVTVLAFNFTVIASVILLWQVLGFGGWLSIGLGAVLGGIVAGVVWMLKK